MNRNKTILFALFVVYLATGLLSCAKKESPSTPLGKLQGKWKLIKFAPGDNAHGPLVFSPLDKEEDWEWTFNSDGTGFDIENWNATGGIKENFSYRVFYVDSLWIGTATHDTTTYYITEINASDMIWTKSYTDSSGIRITQGMYFIKY